jgi:AcrR family transcriptional regulator
MSARSVSARPVSASRGTVLDAACRLFADRGYRGTSMKDIAEALGVRAPSLYNHVTSKQEILFAIMDKAMDRALTALEEALAGVEDTSEQLRRATESLVLDFLRFPAEVTVCNTEVRSLEEANRLAIVAKRDQYAARVRRIIEEGCRSGRFSTRTPQIAAFAVLEMGNGAKSWFRPSGRFPDAFVASEYGEFALRVVGCVRLRAAGLGGGAGDLGVQSDVVERAGHDRQGHRRARGAVQVGGTEVAALAGRGGTDNEPEEKNHRSLAHHRLLRPDLARI